MRRGSVLEIGCGKGELDRALSQSGASSDLRLDVSEHELGFARQHEELERIEFRAGNAEGPIEGAFDVFCGLSILHHLEYRPMLELMYDENLNPGGLMAFQEPLGGGALIKLYKWKVRNAHTSDEKSFLKDDLMWFRRTFPAVRIESFGYTSFLFGILSSKLFRRPDNALLNLCHHLDMALARFRPLQHRFRRCNIFIEKPN